MGFAMRLFQRDASAIGQHGQGLGELDAFHLHHEAEDVAADVADPALERLPLGVDLKTGVRVVVPGAKTDVVAALAAKLDHSAHQIDDVDRLPNLFFGIERRSHRRRQLQHATTSEFHFACSPVSLPEASCPRWPSQRLPAPVGAALPDGHSFSGEQIIAQRAKMVNRAECGSQRGEKCVDHGISYISQDACPPPFRPFCPNSAESPASRYS